MKTDNDSLFGLGLEEQRLLTEQLAASKLSDGQEARRQRQGGVSIPARFGSFAEMPQYKELQVQRVIADKMRILDPFFICHDSMAKGRTHIHGAEYLNFGTYDYLGLNGHPEVNAAAGEAMEHFGTSAGASRLVAGERPQHSVLESALAEVFQTEKALAFVSGHATNVSVLSTLFSHRDAIYHDSLAHNSIIMGAKLSGAARYSFPHNDCEALEHLLEQTRSNHERAIIVTEGLFSMDGSVARLPELIELKKRYTCFLMLDEAHALGVLGETGKGTAEYFGLPPREVDIWMGTLSKTLCSCGGFVAGCAEMIELLRFRAPGFVYSVGISPPLAAASAKALEIMLREPERVSHLRELSIFFLQEAQTRGLNTGFAQGFAIVPVIVGNSLVAGLVAAAMFRRGVNVLPIIYPVVEEGLARLRFFLSSEHRKEDILAALDILAEELPKARKKAS
jgi:8-amino-7-oxononanoate synthase